MTWSHPAEASVFPSGANARQYTQLVCPASVERSRSRPMIRFQKNRSDQSCNGSPAADRMRLPRELIVDFGFRINPQKVKNCRSQVDRSDRERKGIGSFAIG